MRTWHRALRLLTRTLPRSESAPRIKGGFLNRVVSVDGSDYRYQVFVPAGWSMTSKWPVILALHGGGAFGSDGIRQTKEGLGPVLRRHPERFAALVIFPQSPANGTPGWQGVGGRIALASLDKTIDEFSGDKSRVALTGLSMGGNGAWFLAYHQPGRFAGLLVVCGFVGERMGSMQPIRYPSLVPGAADPSVAVAQRLAQTPVWIFHGDADTTVPVEHSRRMADALRALGAPILYTELPGVGHNAWDTAYNRPDVASWLLQVRQDSRGI